MYGCMVGYQLGWTGYNNDCGVHLWCLIVDGVHVLCVIKDNAMGVQPDVHSTISGFS